MKARFAALLGWTLVVTTETFVVPRSPLRSLALRLERVSLAETRQGLQMMSLRPERSRSFDEAVNRFDARLQGDDFLPAVLEEEARLSTWTADTVKSQWKESAALATQKLGGLAPPRMHARFTDAGTLLLQVNPATEKSAMAVAAPGMIFSASWLSVVSSLTFKMIRTRSPVGALFMLPFWYAGVSAGKDSIDLGRRATSTLVVKIGEHEWEILEVHGTRKRNRLFGDMRLLEEGNIVASGATDSLQSVRVIEEWEAPEEKKSKQEARKSSFVVYTNEGENHVFKAEALAPKDAEWLATALDEFVSRRSWEA